MNSTPENEDSLAGPPAVSGVSPKGGPGSGGTSVNLTGSGFTGAAAVTFGATAAASFDLTSDTQLTAVSPAGIGTVDVSVTTPAGTSGANPDDQFTYLAVTGVSPASGAAGSTVQVSGSGFTGATAVHFGNDPADMNAVHVAPDGTSLTLTIGSVTVDVTVTTPLGTSPTVPADQFTYTSGKEGKDTKEGKDGKDGKEHKDHKDVKDKEKDKEAKEEFKEGKPEGKEHKDLKDKDKEKEGKGEGKEHKDHKDVKDKDKEGKEGKEGKEKESKEDKETKEKESKEKESKEGHEKPLEAPPPGPVDSITHAPIAGGPPVGRPFIAAEERPAVGRKALRDGTDNPQ